MQDNPSRVTVTQMVRGVLEGYRLNSGFPLNFSIIGRDAYNLQKAEPRNTGELLGTSNLDPGGFGSAFWAAQYRTVRTANVLLESLKSSTLLTDQEKETTRGIVNTIKALELFTVWMAHDTAGMVVKVGWQSSRTRRRFSAAIRRSATLPSCWIPRRRSSMRASRAGSRSRRLPAGFANFNNKTTFLTFNRAWKAKADVYRRQYQSALTALSRVVHRHGQRPVVHAGAGGARSRADARVQHVSGRCAVDAVRSAHGNGSRAPERVGGRGDRA